MKKIVNISSYFSIIAHTPGRLRVRVNPKIVNEAQNISLDDITNLPKKISGIEDIKINKIIASVTIIYNPTIFKPKLWEDLIKNENLDEITKIINNKGGYLMPIDYNILIKKRVDLNSNINIDRADFTNCYL